ncbi:MAG: hypothetical protein ACREIJ_13715, partial [Nitrospiraceae bacterium]
LLLQSPIRCCDGPSAGRLAPRTLTVLLGTGALLFGACPRLEERDRHRRRRRSQSPGLRAPVSRRVSAISRRTVMNNAG